MLSTATASSEFFRMLLQAVSLLGLSQFRVLSLAGIDEDFLSQRGARLPISDFRVAWTVAELDAGPGFGLKAAEALRRGALDIVDYVMFASASCGEATARLIRYAPLLADAAQLSLHRAGGRVQVVYDCQEGLEALIDFSFALIVLRLREFTRGRSHPSNSLQSPPLRPMGVFFRHAPSAELEHYRKIFDAPVHFCQPRNELVFDSASFERKIDTADPTLLAILDDHATTQLRLLTISQPSPINTGGNKICQIRASVRSCFLKGNPSIQSAAELLAISPRTIQRRLRSQGLSFREVVQQIRVELMTELLSSEAPSRARMKSILGYSSERSVDRAYHRWTAQRACGGVGR